MTHHIMAGLVLAVVATCPVLSWADFAARVVTVHEGIVSRSVTMGEAKRFTSKISIVPNSSSPMGKRRSTLLLAMWGTATLSCKGSREASRGVCLPRCCCMTGAMWGASC